MGLCHVRDQKLRPLVTGGRVGKLSLVLQRIAEIAEHVRIYCQRERLLIRGDRFGKLALIVQHATEIIEGTLVVGLELHRPPIVRDGFIQLAECAEGGGQRCSAGSGQCGTKVSALPISFTASSGCPRCKPITPR